MTGPEDAAHYEDGYDVVFNRRVALAGGGTAWLTLCADLVSECEVGEVFAFDDDGTEVRLTPEEYARLDEYIHEVQRCWLAEQGGPDEDRRYHDRVESRDGRPCFY